MKILMSAYACEPNRGSEEGIGWNLVTQAAKHYEVWVLTRSFYQLAIETELQHNPLPNLHFIYFDPLNWTSDWRDTQGAVQLHYYLWQIQAYFIGKSLHEHNQLDLVHHVTYGKYWSPSFLALLPLPFVWGPVGGGDSAPLSFWNSFGIRGQIYELLRGVAQRLGELDPFTRITASRSMIAIAATDGTAKRLKSLGADVVRVMSQVGLSDKEIRTLSELGMAKDTPLKFLSIGRLLHWKGYHLALSAFAEAKIPKAEYWFFGDGIEKKRLEALAKTLGIQSKVRFFGKLNRDDMFAKIRECHVLVHPSLHEAGGFVCAEMMAAGRPVICLDLGGPALQVSESAGVKVATHSPEQTIQDLAKAMDRLAKDAPLRLHMGKVGQQRVNVEFNWNSIGQSFTQIYRAVLEEGKSP